MLTVDITLSKEIFDQLEDKEGWTQTEGTSYTIITTSDVLDKIVKQFGLVQKLHLSTEHNDYFNLLKNGEIVGDFSV